MTPSLQRIAVVGGGPGGLFLSSLLAGAIPDVKVTLFERNQRTDAFGFGVVFSDATLRAIDAADPVLSNGLRDFGTHWDRIEVWSKGERHGFGGNGMAAIHRKVLLQLLQENAERAGAELHFGTPAPDLVTLLESFDVVVGADGTNSIVRAQVEESGDVLEHRVDVASAKFIWFGTTQIFDGLTFVHRVSEHGNFAAHAYPISDELSTFIVETDEVTWRRAGLDRFDVDQPPGPSDEASQAYLEKLFAEDLDGGHLVANNSRWSNFRTRRTERWTSGRVALLGDAVHTAHFSVGSGTKMAMEDSVVLAEQLVAVAKGEQELASAFAAYEEKRKVSVGRIQSAAGPSLSWWEHFGDYQQRLDPVTFAFHFFSRSIDVDRIEQRDPELVAEVRDDWQSQHGAAPLASTLDVPTEHGRVSVQRRLTQRETDGDRTTVVDDRGTEVTAALVLVNPDTAAALTAPLPDAGSVVIAGPPSLHRTLVAEEARLRRGLVTLVAGPDLADDAVAETMLLSGRADAVVTQAATDQPR